MSAGPVYDSALADKNIRNVELKSVDDWNDHKTYLVKEFTFSCPIDYAKDKTIDNSIDVTFWLAYGLRSDAGKFADIKWEPVNNRPPGNNWNVFLYLCGGPGSKNLPTKMTGIIDILLKKGYWVLFPNYRGTGMWKRNSEPMNISKDPLGGLEVYRHLRPRDIVRDLEAVRLILMGKRPWGNTQPEKDICSWGQSFGTFITMSYLSFFPQGLRRACMSGGPPDVEGEVKETHRKLLQKARELTEEVYQNHPGLQKQVKEIFKYLAKKEMETDGKGVQMGESGGRLGPKRFMTLGRAFGAKKSSDGVVEVIRMMHKDITTDLANTGKRLELSQKTIQEYIKWEGWKLGERPDFAVMCESQWTPKKGESSSWAAEQVAKEGENENYWWWIDRKPEELMTKVDNPKHKLYFSTEVIFKFFFVEPTWRGLAGFEGIADKVAKIRWHENQYDVGVLKGLSKTNPRATALSYKSDPYVPNGFSLNTRDSIGAKNLELITHSTWEHTEIKQNPLQVFNRVVGRGA
ncbi:hypothetical protein F5Y15DRAFT_156382 [Xylariaceae sp. FL0016]|nr:hypothetical protein F5Y15DRAFT_156382 [Xylariaceae sp. FL0016]